MCKHNIYNEYMLVLSAKLKEDKECLRLEVEALNIKLKQSSQVRELASMLQESHK